MKLFRLLAVAVISLVVLTPAASAANFGVRAGMYNDADEEFVGAEFAWDAGVLTFNPNIEYLLTDNDQTALTGNFDLLYNFGQAAWKPYVGGGVGVMYVDDDFFGDSTEGLFNVIGGIKWDLDFLQPYAQVKYFKLFDDDVEGDDIAFTVGLRF